MFILKILLTLILSADLAGLVYLFNEGINKYFPLKEIKDQPLYITKIITKDM